MIRCLNIALVRVFSGGIPSKYPTPHSLKTYVIVSHHCDWNEPLACLSFTIWKSKCDTLLDSPIASLVQKLIILCFIIHCSLLRPSLPSTIQFTILGCSCRMYLQVSLDSLHLCYIRETWLQRRCITKKRQSLFGPIWPFPCLWDTELQVRWGLVIKGVLFWGCCDTSENRFSWHHEYTYHSPNYQP